MKKLRNICMLSVYTKRSQPSIVSKFPQIPEVITDFYEVTYSDFLLTGSVIKMPSSRRKTQNKN